MSANQAETKQEEGIEVHEHNDDREPPSGCVLHGGGGTLRPMAHARERGQHLAGIGHRSSCPIGRRTGRRWPRACLNYRQWEDFFAYPGAALLRKIDESIASGDAIGAARAIHQISMALSSHSYRENAGDWEAGDESQSVLREVVKGLGQEGAPHKPYFEVLIVSPSGPSARAQAAQELRKLRRQQDRFVYEPVVVGSFEDAVLGTILNGSIQAVVIYDSIPFASVHNSPVLRQFLTEHLGAGRHQEDGSGLRPHSRARAEGHPPRAGHLSVERPQRGKDRGRSPRRDAFAGSSTRWKSRWKSTSAFSTESPTGSRRRTSTIFRSTPSARSARSMRCPSPGANPFSNRTGFGIWARFTASTCSSPSPRRPRAGWTACWSRPATSKLRKQKAARAFGADHVFFVTNGTSTSNKMVEQALLRPGTSSWSTATATSRITTARSFPGRCHSTSRRFR